jgi:ligand-binding sensor domain-containing protein
MIFYKSNNILADDQSKFFTRIGIEEGLAPGNVNDIIQDSLGFIWLGTEGGLCRYDGYNFKIFKNDIHDTTSLSFNHVFTLLNAGDGIIWVGTLGGGLNKFDTRTEEFIRYKHQRNNPNSLSSDIIFKIYEDSQDRIWISTLGGGLNLFNEENEIFKRFLSFPNKEKSISSNMASAIFEDSCGNIWIGTFDNGLNLFNDDTESFTHFNVSDIQKYSLNHNQIMDIIELSSDTLLIATFGGGINVMNISRGKFTNYQNENNFVFNTEHKNIRKLFDDGDNIWIGSYNGLYKYWKKSLRMQKYINDQNNNKTLNNNKIREIFKDRNGIIWIGTTNGVNIYDPNRKQFDFHSFNDEYSKLFNDSYSIPDYISNEMILWAGKNYYNDNSSLAGRGIRYYGNPKIEGRFKSNVSVNFYEDENNQLWIGDYDGLKYFDKINNQFYYIEFFSGNIPEQGNNFVKSFFIDSKGDFWAGTLGGGLTHFNVDKKIVKRHIHLEEDEASISDSRVMPILEDSNGNLWIGTYGGLNKFDKENEIFIQYTNQVDDTNSLSNDRIFSIYESSNSDLWIGTYQGLNLYIKDKNYFERITTKDGLWDNTIFSILEDNNGNLWLRTNKGISKYDHFNRIIRNYGKSDGLEGMESNGTVSIKDKNGRLFFSSVRGFYSFIPSTIEDSPIIPDVFFTQLKVMDDVITVGSSNYLPNTLNHINELQLSYLDKVFTIEFSSSHFAIPAKNKYAYMLEGFRDTWTYVDASNRFATFTNLNPGRYTLHIKASNNDGIWNDVGRSLKIVISPPFWATWWFRLGVIIIILLVIFIAYEYRLKRLIEIERTRARIARNLHDDVGGTLASIQYFVDGIRKNSDQTKIDKFLNLIIESSNDAQEKIKDIIWTVNPKEDSLSKFFIKFKRHSSDLFDTYNIIYEIILPKVEPDKKIGMEKRQHLWCICKETVTNVIKHSKCKNVKISFSLFGNRLKYSIEDDGLGFEKGKVEPGNGLANIFFRAEKLNAECDYDTEEGKGFKLKISFQI